MDRLDLSSALLRPNCPKCKLGRIRPIWQDNRSLDFNCSGNCGWRGRAALPELSKTIIYLDTSIASHIGRARRADQRESRWLRLREVLQRGIAKEVISCPVSTILRSEVEIASSADAIIEVAESLGDPAIRHRLDVEAAQVARALDRFLTGAEPVCEIRLPRTDALDKNINSWRPMFNLHLKHRYSERLRNSMLETKQSVHKAVQNVYSRYAAEGLSRDDIRRQEAKGFGSATLTLGLRALRNRLLLESGKVTGEEVLADLLPTAFDVIVQHIREKKGVEYAAALAEAERFCRSDYISMTAVAEIRAELTATVAMSVRGRTPRALKPSDSTDIDHIATYMPYVDVFITDGFFAEIANRSDVRLGDRYGMTIRTLTPSEVDGFVAFVEGLIAASPMAKLAERIEQAIIDGGYMEQQSARLKSALQQRGVLDSSGNRMPS